MTASLPNKVCLFDFKSNGFPRDLAVVYIFLFLLFLPVIVTVVLNFYILQDASILSTDDDLVPESFDSQTKNTTELAVEIPSLLSASELLESVCWPFHALLYYFCILYIEFQNPLIPVTRTLTEYFVIV